MKKEMILLLVLLSTGCDDNPSYTEKDIKTVCEEVQHNLGPPLSEEQADYFASIMEMNGIEPPNAAGMRELVTNIKMAGVMGRIRGQLFVPSCFEALKKELGNPK